MIWEILQCLLPKVTELAAEISHQNLSLSNLILSFYLVTHRKTALMGLSFFVSEIFGFVNGFGLYFGEHHIYMGSLLITAYFSMVQLSRLRSKSVAFCCLALLCLFLYASYDAYAYPKTETLFYSAYPNILLCIHVCLILSFYKPRTIINNMVDKLRDFVRLLRHNYTMQYLWYTVRHRYQQM